MIELKNSRTLIILGTKWFARVQVKHWIVWICVYIFE